MAEGSTSVKDTGVRALPTEFRGVRFRSRMEARWAVFLQSLGVPWEYEPEGFDLGEGVWYLPDFWLPRERIWIEVKPTPDLAPEDERKLRAFARLATEAPEAVWSPRQVILLVGNPIAGEGDPYSIRVPDRAHDGHFAYYPYWDNYHAWAACTECRRVGIQFMGYAGRLCDCHDYHKQAGDQERIERAATAALAERFVR